MNYRAYTAELLGTFLLTLFISLALLSGIPEVTPFVAAITLLVLVYMFGEISGCHLNPAVTVALWSVKKISTADMGGYIGAQIIGALFAMGLTTLLVGSTPSLFVENLPLLGVAEALGTAVLLLGICAVVYKKAPAPASGFTIGGALLLGQLLAGTVSNGVLNPAVALGVGSISLLYIVSPIVGAIAAAQLYKWLVG